MENGEAMEELKNAVDELKVSIARIEIALLGDAKLGIEGVVGHLEKTNDRLEAAIQRIQVIETDKSNIKSGYVSVVAVLAALLGLWNIVKGFWHK